HGAPGTAPPMGPGDPRRGGGGTSLRSEPRDGAPRLHHASGGGTEDVPSSPARDLEARGHLPAPGAQDPRRATRGGCSMTGHTLPEGHPLRPLADLLDRASVPDRDPSLTCALFLLGPVRAHALGVAALGMLGEPSITNAIERLELH